MQSAAYMGPHRQARLARAPKIKTTQNVRALCPHAILGKARPSTCRYVNMATLVSTAPEGVLIDLQPANSTTGRRSSPGSWNPGERAESVTRRHGLRRHGLRRHGPDVTDPTVQTNVRRWLGSRPRRRSFRSKRRRTTEPSAPPASDTVARQVNCCEAVTARSPKPRSGRCCRFRPNCTPLPNNPQSARSPDNYRSYRRRGIRP